MNNDENQKNNAEHADFRVAILDLQASNQKIHDAIFGDEFDIGMKAKTDKNYAVLMGWAFVLSICKWILAVMTAVGGASGLLYHFLGGKRP